MKKLSLLLLVACSAFFVACGDDNEDPIIKSSAAEITAISFDSEYVISQPDLSEGNELTLYVEDGSEENLKEVVVTIAVSEGATVNPTSGSKMDLSKGNVEFTVTAEDEETTKKYTVKVSTSKSRLFYNFDEWSLSNTTQKDERKQYFKPTEGTWASSNNGVINVIEEINYKFPVTETKDSRSGSAARIENLKTEEIYALGLIKLPFLTAGSLFTGKFSITAGLNGPLKTTQFGVTFEKKPIEVRGYYKYKAGKDFYRGINNVDKNGNLQPEKAELVTDGTTDECVISGVLYEYEKATGDYLDGSNIYTDERVVAKAVFTSKGADDYIPFSAKFEYKDEAGFDKNRKDKKYRLAIIASSARFGDTFSGAPGSVLYVDDIEIISE